MTVAIAALLRLSPTGSASITASRSAGYRCTSTCRSAAVAPQRGGEPVDRGCDRRRADVAVDHDLHRVRRADAERALEARGTPASTGSGPGATLRPFSPVFRPMAGSASRISRPALSASAMPGRRSTRSTTASQKRLSPLAERPTYGTRSALTRSPSSERTAGNNVSAAAIDTSATRIAPAARLRKIVLGTSSRPVIAKMNASPLKTTARLAVMPDTAIASSFSRPAVRSSRKRESTNSV